MDAIYEERESDWSQQDLVVGTTQWLQHDQTLPLSAKGVACETSISCASLARETNPVPHPTCWHLQEWTGA